ncbi:MAG TPA: hypothetical protein VGO50_18445 [Pyrinomonadaceae bacterium]|nr:hypothetical protein [Pyrinomonadaceae bacterium]
MNYFNYFSEIEETFIRRRGKSLLLSPLDWTLIESWQKRGIPQHIVIRSVEKIFDDIAKDPKRNPSIKSIAYCADEVERQYRDWVSSQAGGRTEGSESPETTDGNTTGNAEIVSHLQSLTEELGAASQKADTALSSVLTATLNELEKLKQTAETAGANTESIEKELTKLEAEIDKALMASAGEEELAAAKKAVEGHLGQYAGKMQQDVYEKTFELMVVKKLRENAGIPAFSLFYL